MKCRVAELNRWIAILAGFIGTLAVAPAGAAPAPQPLSVSIHGDGARATRLAEYDPGAPIAVRVIGTAQPLDTVTVIAAGPAGESIRVPLTRAADGSFAGLLRLADQGPWQLRLTSRTGPLSSESTPVIVDVQTPPPSNATAIGICAGFAIFTVLGGGGFLVLRRASTARRMDQLDDAA